MTPEEFKKFCKEHTPKWSKCPLCGKEWARLNIHGNCGTCYGGKGGRQVEISERVTYEDETVSEIQEVEE